MKKIDLDIDPKITTGFKVPEGYFDTLEDRVMQNITWEEKNSKINTGFSIPKDYFNTLENNIMSKLEVNKETPVIALWQRKSVWISSIAALFLISLGTLFFWNNSQEELTISQDYLAYQSDITTEDIAVHLTDEDIQALETELTPLDSNAESYINDYLN